jgi:hypothetical protein
MTMRAHGSKNPKLSVATDAELSAILDTYLVNGDLVFSEASGFYLTSRTSVAPLSSTVLAMESSSGGTLPGRYLFTGISSSGSSVPIGAANFSQGATDPAADVVLPLAPASVIVASAALTITGTLAVRVAAEASGSATAAPGPGQATIGAFFLQIDGGATSVPVPSITQPNGVTGATSFNVGWPASASFEFFLPAGSIPAGLHTFEIVGQSQDDGSGANPTFTVHANTIGIAEGAMITAEEMG